MIVAGDVECIAGPLDGRVIRPATWPPALTIVVPVRERTRVCDDRPLAALVPPRLARHLYRLEEDRAGRFCYVHAE